MALVRRVIFAIDLSPLRFVERRKERVALDLGVDQREVQPVGPGSASA